MTGFRRLFAAVIAACLVVGCCGSVFAQQTQHPLISVDQSVSFEFSQENTEVCYAFTAEQDGQFVFYDQDGGKDCLLSVYSLPPEDEGFADAEMTGGIGSISFSVQSGQTYWLEARCAGNGLRSFLLAAPTAVESLALEGITLTDGEIGATGSVNLICMPYGSADLITWTSSDDTVVSVSGDGNGASYQLLRAGTATLTATTSGGISVSFDVSVTDPNALVPDQIHTVTIPANGGLYSESEHTFTFTPEVSGAYALAVGFDKSVDMWCGVQMSTSVNGEYLYSGSVLRFEAEAGVTYTIEVEFWGNYAQSVDYQFVIEVSGEPQGITLIPETTAGYVSDSLYINVAWNPQTSRIEPLTWISSDPLIADITYTSDEYAVLELYAAGQVTITASTASGLIHSTQIDVYDAPGLLVLEQDVAQPLMLLGYGNQQISFTPAQTGYYQLHVSSEDMDAYLFESGAYVGDRYLYYLIGGQTYGGGVDCYTADMATGELLITKVEVLSPTGMTITAEPDTTVYLKAELEDLWTYEVLAGLRLDIIWSDGSVSAWSFDEEGPYIGDEELNWQIAQDPEDGKWKLMLSCGELAASCEMMVLDKMIQQIRLVDDTPLKLYEYSCGVAMGDGSWLYDNYSYCHRQVELVFSDGSAIVASPDEQVYGFFVTCQDDQQDAPWVVGGDNRVTYSYGSFTTELMVEILPSPVDRLELITLPENTFLLGDSKFFTKDSDGSYYFTPVNTRDFLAGLSFVIWNKDGSSQTVTEADIQWLMIEGREHPFVDGYPMGLFSDFLMGMEPINGPCDKTGFLEFKGASVTYPIYVVEEIPVDPPVDPTDPTDPVDPSTVPTEPSTEPTEPSSEPTEPSTEPTEPSSEPTEPSTEPSVPPATTDPEIIPPTEDSRVDYLPMLLILATIIVACLMIGKKTKA